MTIEQKMDAIRPFKDYVSVLKWFALARESTGKSHADVVREIHDLRGWPHTYNTVERHGAVQRFNEAELITLELAPDVVAPNPYIFYALRRVFSLELSPQERVDICRSIDERREKVEAESSRLYAVARDIQNPV